MVHSPGYAYVHESVAEAFVAEARKALVELFGKDPKSNSDYSRIINGRAAERLASVIDPGKVIAVARVQGVANHWSHCADGV
jgi:aldehyde dehydrogenase (NAD+)